MQITPINSYQNKNIEKKSLNTNNVNFKQVILRSEMPPQIREGIMRSSTINELANGLAQRGMDLYCSIGEIWYSSIHRPRTLELKTHYQGFNNDYSIFRVSLPSALEKRSISEIIDNQSFNVKNFLESCDRFNKFLQEHDKQ